MEYLKGRSGNPRGRPKGAESKSSTFVRETVKRALGKEPIDYILELIEGLPTRGEKLEHLQKLLPYMHPKLSNVEHSGAIDTGGNAETVDKLVGLLKELKK